MHNPTESIDHAMHRRSRSSNSFKNTLVTLLFHLPPTTPLQLSISSASKCSNQSLCLCQRQIRNLFPSFITWDLKPLSAVSNTHLQRLIFLYISILVSSMLRYLHVSDNLNFAHRIPPFATLQDMGNHCPLSQLLALSLTLCKDQYALN